MISNSCFSRFSSFASAFFVSGSHGPKADFSFRPSFMICVVYSAPTFISSVFASGESLVALSAERKSPANSIIAFLPATLFELVKISFNASASFPHLNNASRLACLISAGKSSSCGPLISPDSVAVALSLTAERFAARFVACVLISVCIPGIMTGG
ncbi:hypothetical protein NGUA15_04897 [Salmonella enterica]|nr:hypothetical protein NGUA15_04897 [Salmonella enterica]